MRPSIKWLLVAFIVLVIGDCLGVLPGEPVMHLAAGWVMFIARTLRTARVSWEGVIGAGVCLAGVVVVGHSTCAWLWRGMERPGRWRLRWTAAGVLGIVTMFAAGLAVTGVGHQVVWLAKSDRPIMRQKFGARTQQTIDSIKCMSNLKQIGVALEQYAASHDGRWPADLRELLATSDVSAKVLVCPASDDVTASGETKEEAVRNLEGHLSYVYYGRGWRGRAPATRPVVSEPLKNHDGDGVCVLFGDGHAEWVKAADALNVLRGE